MGFWVARTKKGCGRAWVSPITVTRRSCMASSRADWVLGEARLISSASMMLAKTGPSWKTKVFAPFISWRTGVPVMSPGSRSGVNWTRRAVRASALESPLTSSVLPRPGSPSSRMWPRASTPMRTSSMRSSLPNSTWFMAAAKASSFLTAWPSSSWEREGRVFMGNCRMTAAFWKKARGVVRVLRELTPCVR